MGWHYLNHQKAASLTVRRQIFEREAVERFFFFYPGEGRGKKISPNVFKSHPADELDFYFFSSSLTSLVFLFAHNQ